jgi:hypothetical protein
VTDSSAVYTSFPAMDCDDAHTQVVSKTIGQDLWLADALAFPKDKGVAP